MITKQELETIKAKAPLLSEGAISPFQVSNMSKREKTERERNIQIRYNAECQYKKENMTEEEKEKKLIQGVEAKIKNLETKIQLKQRTISYLKSLPAFQSKRMNDTRRGVIIEEDEIKKDELKIKELKGRLKIDGRN